MRVYEDNYDHVREAMMAFLRAEIERYIEIAGSKRALAKALGKSATYVIMAQQRDTLSGLEEVWRACRARYDK